MSIESFKNMDESHFMQVQENWHDPSQINNPNYHLAHSLYEERDVKNLETSFQMENNYVAG